MRHNDVRGWETAQLVQALGRTRRNFLTVTKMKFIVHRPESKLVACLPEQLIHPAGPAIVHFTILRVLFCRLPQKIPENIESLGISKTAREIRIASNECSRVIADLVQG